MLKKFLPLLLAPLLLAGCTSVITNLTPTQQTRNPDNLYHLEAALATRQQTLRWDSIKPQILVGKDAYPMLPTKLMTNRWEGVIRVPPGTSEVRYRYKFDFKYNAMGAPKSDSAMSSEYTLRILAP